MTKKKLLALWLVVALVFAAFSGGATTALLSDTERMQVTITAGNAGNVGNWASTSTSGSEYDGEGDPGIDYVAFVSEDSEPGVSWSVGSENANGEPVSIFWTTAMDKNVDYVVVGYEYDGQDKVNIYDYTTRSGGIAGTATSLGSSDPTRSIANVTSYTVSSALGVDEIEEKANSITDSELDDANTNDTNAKTTLKIAYDASNDKFTGELAGDSGYTLPKAADDNNTTNKGTTLEVDAPGVLSNDVEGGATLFEGLDPNSSVELYENGSFTYKPDAGFSGTYSFTYRLSDGNAADTATVNITVK